MNSKIAEKLQSEIYSGMPLKRKLEIVSQFILLAKKLKSSKVASKSKRKK